MNNLSGLFEQIAIECLDAVISDRVTVDECLKRHPGFSVALKPILLTVVALRRTRRVIRPSISFARGAEARLQARLLSSSRPPAPTQTPRQRIRLTILQRFDWNPLRSLPTAIAMVILLLVISGAGVVTAADLSRPGDPLYGLDRALEQVSLTLADDETDIQLQLEMAQERLTEAEQLVEMGRQDEANEALTDYQIIVDDLEASGPDADLTQTLTNLDHQRAEIQPGPVDEHEMPTGPDNDNPRGAAGQDGSNGSSGNSDNPSGMDAPGKSEDAQGNSQSSDAPGNWQNAPGQTPEAPSGAGNNNAGGNSGGNDNNNAGGSSNNNGNGGSGNNGNGQNRNSGPPDDEQSGGGSQRNGNATGSQNNNGPNGNQNNSGKQKNTGS